MHMCNHTCKTGLLQNPQCCKFYELKLYVTYLIHCRVTKNTFLVILGFQLIIKERSILPATLLPKYQRCLFRYNTWRGETPYNYTHVAFDGVFHIRLGHPSNEEDWKPIAFGFTQNWSLNNLLTEASCMVMHIGLVNVSKIVQTKSLLMFRFGIKNISNQFFCGNSQWSF